MMGGRLILFAALCLGLQSEAGFAEGNVVARISPSGETVVLERQVNGKVQKDYLPLHHGEGVRYFSAGVGLEERAAEYPPFALKVVFTAGGKPFLSRVDVTIHSATGDMVVHIPADQVDGPWLFVDLPSGSYDITASHAGRTQGLRGIKVEEGKQRVIHLRWAEDAELPGS